MAGKITTLQCCDTVTDTATARSSLSFKRTNSGFTESVSASVAGSVDVNKTCQLNRARLFRRRKDTVVLSHCGTGIAAPLQFLSLDDVWVCRGCSIIARLFFSTTAVAHRWTCMPIDDTFCWSVCSLNVGFTSLSGTNTKIALSHAVTAVRLTQ